MKPKKNFPTLKNKGKWRLENCYQPYPHYNTTLVNILNHVFCDTFAFILILMLTVVWFVVMLVHVFTSPTKIRSARASHVVTPIGFQNFVVTFWTISCKFSDKLSIGIISNNAGDTFVFGRYEVFESREISAGHRTKILAIKS